MKVAGRLKRLVKNSLGARQSPSAASKPRLVKTPFIAEVHRRATQKQGQSLVFQQTLKPRPFKARLRDHPVSAGQFRIFFFG
jgi:hypothetical protein